MQDIWLLPVTFVVSFLGTWLMVVFSRQRQWLDIPNDRSSHSKPTPTSGGVAFFLVFAVAVLISFRHEDIGFNYYLILFLTACIALVGLADDLFELGIPARITTQALVVAGALAQFGLPAIPVAGGTMLESGWAAYPLALLFFLWFINLFNFMDGLDGLAATESIFVCLAIVLITFGGDSAGINRFMLLLVAAVSGFLVLNVAPARIFMGDVGSNVLGYLLIVSALASTGAGLTSIWEWLILSGVFIVDATYTLLARMFNGETWYYAHRSHAYQLAAGYLGSHGKVVSGVALINMIWLLPLAWLAHRNPAWGALLLVMAWLPLSILTQMLRNKIATVTTA